MERKAMNCQEYLILLDEQTERSLTEAEQEDMAAHEAQCPACAEKTLTARDLRALWESTEVPPEFSAAWRSRVREEESMNWTTPKKRNWKGILAIAAALIFVLGGTALTRDGMPRRTVQENGAVYDSAYVPAPTYTMSAKESAVLGAMPRMAVGADYDDVVEEEAEYSAEAPAEAGREEKIIRSASFTLRTAEFDAAMEKLQALTADCGGRVEYLSRKGDAQSGDTRSASLTLRIPAEQLDVFLAGTEGLGAVTALTQESRDVSDSYYDVRTRLETQKNKMERLQKLMLEADEVSDMIEIESAIADTQYYIDSYTAQLSGMDSRVAYSTVEVSVRETKTVEIREAGLGERILSALKASAEEGLLFLQDMLIFVVSALPWLIGVGAAVLIVRWIIRKRKRRNEQ